MYKSIRYQLEILESPENIAKSLESLSSDSLVVKLSKISDKDAIALHMSRREGAFELRIEGEILRGKGRSTIKLSGEMQISRLNIVLQRGLVMVLALLAAASVLQLALWFLPVPMGLVDSCLFLSGTIALLLVIGTLAWLADFFLLRRVMQRDGQRCQSELRHWLAAILARVQSVNRDEAETMTI